MVIGPDLTLRNMLIQHFHAGSNGGHSGVLVTYKKLSEVFLLERNATNGEEMD